MSDDLAIGIVDKTGRNPMREVVLALCRLGDSSRAAKAFVEAHTAHLLLRALTCLRSRIYGITGHACTCSVGTGVL